MRGKLVPDTFSPVDVLDRLVDKGVVIEKGWVMLPLDLVRLEAQVVISSLNTYLAEAGGLTDASTEPPS